jgi:hypothetical protein
MVIYSIFSLLHFLPYYMICSHGIFLPMFLPQLASQQQLFDVSEPIYDSIIVLFKWHHQE